MQGTLFHDRMKAEVLRKIKQDLVSLEDEYIKNHPRADIQRV
jgi:peptide deformylase